jgi:hypothetical protein
MAPTYIRAFCTRISDKMLRKKAAYRGVEVWWRPEGPTCLQHTTLVHSSSLHSHYSNLLFHPCAGTLWVPFGVYRRDMWSLTDIRPSWLPPRTRLLYPY